MYIKNFKIKNNHIISQANRGMNAEDAINIMNEYYLNYDIAVIYKKPTPVQIVTVDYPSRNKAIITEAYYKTPSTTDYNGIYKGYYIDFEVKETHNKVSYPLVNIKEHQYIHLKRIKEHKGIAFIILKWTYYNEYYLIMIDNLIKYFKEKKSITYLEVKQDNYLIPSNNFNRVDYLKIIDKIINI